MVMQMVHVWRVGVVVGQRLVLVQVVMTDSRCHRKRMGVLVMRSMHMAMIMFHKGMGMAMFVTLGEMHPDAPAHQRPGDH